MISTPWVEKYRPSKFEDIILDRKNKQIFENIIETDCFPNLLAHGFPGTGKTTTIMNLITLYFSKKKISPFSMIIHLNASDERGIDIIRNQINNFVNSKSLLFRKENCLKFVVLDEIDYMTKNAQQALKYLIQTTTTDVRFCLMCNYISRIDEGLQNDFLKVRFNSLPLSNTFSFLKEICVKEQVDIEDVDLYKVIKFFKNDMRSMINFLQCNQHCQGEMMKKSILCDEDFERILKAIENENIETVCECLYQITVSKNISHKQFFLSFLHYCFQQQNLEVMFAKETLNGIEDLLHNSYCETKYFIPLAFKKLQQWLKVPTKTK